MSSAKAWATSQIQNCGDIVLKICLISHTSPIHFGVGIPALSKRRPSAQKVGRCLGPQFRRHAGGSEMQVTSTPRKRCAALGMTTGGRNGGKKGFGAQIVVFFLRPAMVPDAAARR